MDNFLVLGNRVPYEYFLTKGKRDNQMLVLKVFHMKPGHTILP